jgi:hypothetical protein
MNTSSLYLIRGSLFYSYTRVLEGKNIYVLSILAPSLPWSSVSHTLLPPSTLVLLSTAHTHTHEQFEHRYPLTKSSDFSSSRLTIPTSHPSLHNVGRRVCRTSPPHFFGARSHIFTLNIHTCRGHGPAFTSHNSRNQKKNHSFLFTFHPFFFSLPHPIFTRLVTI